MGYQGWSNYPTWSVHLWLSNDEGLYNMVNDLAASSADEDNVPDAYQLSLSLRDMVEEMLPDLGASFAADLLGFAAQEVDYEEIAEAWIAD